MLILKRRYERVFIHIMCGVFVGLYGGLGSAFPETHTRLGIFGESIAEEALIVVPLAAPRKRRED